MELDLIEFPAPPFFVGKSKYFDEISLSRMSKTYIWRIKEPTNFGYAHLKKNSKEEINSFLWR